jgi:lysozyme
MKPASVEDMLLRDEGREHVAYPDPLTRGAPWTIGVGHTGPEVHEGLIWNDFQIDAAFALDVGQATEDCRTHFPWFSTLDPTRQAVLVSMVFQMGVHRVAAFANTLACVECGNYAAAADGMRDSVWAHQTPVRVARLAHQMQKGEWA